MSFVSSTAPIAVLFGQCYIAFDQYLKDLLSVADDDEVGQTDANSCAEQKARLTLWDEEVHAINGQLDHALRRSSRLRQSVLELLTELKEQIQQDPGSTKNLAIDCLSETESSEVFGIGPISTKTLAKDCLSETELSEVSSIGTISTDSSLPLTPAGRSIRYIGEIVTNLTQLAPSLIDAAPTDSNNQITEPGAANPDRFHVEKKFPTANRELLYRLGTAAWKRRQYLMSLRKYNHKAIPTEYKHVPDGISLSERIIRNNSQVFSQPSHHQLLSRSQSSLSAFTGARGHVLNSTTHGASSTKNTGFTSYTGEEGQAVLSDYCEVPQQEPTRLRLPRPPAPNQSFSGAIFECPFCLMQLADITSSKTWRTHVMTDLEPYICTVGSCLRPDKMYGYRQEWFEHELHERRGRKWTCSACCDQKFEFKETFENHILDQHDGTLLPPQLDILARSCEENLGDMLIDLQCPLCGLVCPSEFMFKIHLADELEQLALFALPAGEEHGEDGLDLLEDSDDGSVLMPDTIRFAESDIDASDVNEAPTKVERFLEAQIERVHSPIHEEMDSGFHHPTHVNTGMRREVPFRKIRQPTVNFPITTIGHPRSEDFCTRDEYIDRLHQNLSGSAKTCLIHGVGGVGKTLLAVEYAYRYKNEYDCTFWVQADTEPGMTESLCMIAEELGMLDGSEDPAESVEIAREFLESTDTRWLAIVDNVEQWNSILHFLPLDVPRASGTMIITAQDPSISRFVNFEIGLEPLSREAGGEMLIHYLRGCPPDDMPDSPLAEELSELVGGLPVAISHVAGYIAYSQCPVDELMEIFRQRREYVASENRSQFRSSFQNQSFSYEETFAIFCNITLRELPRDAQDLIYVMAYLNSDAVAESMLQGIHDDPKLEFLDIREPHRYSRLKRQLLRRRLVQTKKVEDEICLSIHRELQRSVRDTLSHDNHREVIAFTQAVTLVSKSFPEPSPIQVPEPEKWPQYKKLLPHVASLRSVYVAADGRIPGTRPFAELLSGAGVTLWEQGIFKEGLQLLSTAEDILESDLADEDSAMRANIHVIIGLLIYSNGISKRKEFFTRRQKTKEIRETLATKAQNMTRSDEILLFNSYTDLMFAFFEFYDYEQAIPMLKYCHDKYDQWGNEDAIPFEYAKYHSIQGSINMYQKDYAAAIKHQEQSVYLMGKAEKRSLSYKHKFDLACAILQSGDVERALKMHEEIYDIRAHDLCGKNNVLTLQSCYAVAVLYERLGRLEEAEKLLKTALNRRRAAEWPEECIARTRYHLSQVITKQDKEPEKAARLHAEAREVLDRLLPLHLPEWLQGEEDEEILFDHLLDAGSRFTGTKLLKRFHDYESRKVETWAPSAVAISGLEKSEASQTHWDEF